MAPPHDRPFRSRSHYTAKGEPKRPLTEIQVRQILAENPDMESYTCPFCQRLHVGNRPRVVLSR